MQFCTNIGIYHMPLRRECASPSKFLSSISNTTINHLHIELISRYCKDYSCEIKMLTLEVYLCMFIGFFILRNNSLYISPRFIILKTEMVQ